MLLLMAAVLVVLGTALANLASLVLVRANERHSELSIRVAIGASRLQLLRQLMVEAFVLAIIGSGIEWILATSIVFFCRTLGTAFHPPLGRSWS